MKRAKIMLTALSVLAIVGAALAFKANKAYNGSLQCTFDTAFPTNHCPLVAFSTVPNGAPALCKPITAPFTQFCVFYRVAFHP